MKTIVVPLDGSALAEHVLPTVWQLARVHQARVVLLRVVEYVEAQPVQAAEGTMSITALTQAQAIQRIRIEQATAYLESQISVLRGSSIAVDYEVCVGNPSEVIVAVAAREPETLIALATHGYSSLRRWALGSVSDKVAQAATVPVLLVRGVEYPALSEHQIKRILVPLDGSEAAQQIVPLALDLARQSDAQLVLVTAINPNVPLAPWRQQHKDATLQRLQATATDTLDTLAAALRQTIESVRTIVEVGYPAEVIVNVAAREQADLIMIATPDVSTPQRRTIESLPIRYYTPLQRHCFWYTQFQAKIPISQSCSRIQQVGIWQTWENSYVTLQATTPNGQRCASLYQRAQPRDGKSTFAHSSSRRPARSATLCCQRGDVPSWPMSI